MAIVRPDQTSGGGGGGGIASWGLATQATFSGLGSPSGVVTPNAVGDLYVDKATPGLYQANGLTNTSWQLIGLESGTAFPSSPADGNWFWRTDRDVLYFWKASVSRWLTVELKEYGLSQPGSVNGIGAAANNFGYFPILDDVYVEKWVAKALVMAPNDGTNNWTISQNKVTTANVQTPITTFNTSLDTAAQWADHTAAVNAMILASGFVLLQSLASVKSAAPGNLFSVQKLLYRVAG